MTEELNFTLPAKKQVKSTSSILVILLLLIVLGVSGANLWLMHNPTGTSTATKGEVLDQAKLKELAGKLTNRNMYQAAAGVWDEYLRLGGIDQQEQARVLYRMGDLLLKAEKPREAIGYFYRSEMVSKVPDLAEQINAKVQECLEKAGQFAALRYELMERSSFKPGEDEAAQIVAELAGDKITAAQLDTMIEDHIDMQLQQYAAVATPEQLNQQREILVNQITSPQQKLQFLQMAMTEAALYREALARELDENANVKKQMRRTTRQFLAQKLLEKEVEPKINVTESDMQTYYQANMTNFVIPAKASISHIQVTDTEQANQVITRLTAGEDFTALAAELSLDEATNEKGGIIELELGRDYFVPGIGRSAVLDEKVFSSKAGTLLDEPIEGENGWHVVLVRSVSSDQQQSFQQVQQEIYQTLTGQKRQELQQQLADELMDKYEIVIHQNIFLDKQPPTVPK
ncbi:MAG: hypothetical protein GY869_17470 [Planctomycetes bacterium]|nr:hypothetical protein [Planctomycetota bacterium]